MNKFAIFLTVLSITTYQLPAADEAEAPPSTDTPQTSQAPLSSQAKTKNTQVKQDISPEVKSIDPFTGKITRNKVRMRLQPNIEAPILKELQKDDCFIVTGLVDDFYSVKPPANLKGYVFRTYVLDGVIEGSRVNIRLEPDTQSPIIGQFNSGDKIDGIISPINSKWIEITLPESVQFFVAKEFVNRIGDATVFKDIEKRKNLLDTQIVQIDGAMGEELKKPFKEIQLAPLASQLHLIINQNGDLPVYTERAQMLLQKMQEAYLQKSITNKQANFPTATHTSKVAVAEQNPTDDTESFTNDSSLTFKEAEIKKVDAAIKNGIAKSESEFYEQEAKHAIRLKGIIKPFMRNVRNAPADFVLVNSATGITTAFIFSTKLNLQKLANKEVTIVAVERANNDFAFPAYFVITADK